ncbi:MAG TPA: flagellar basal body rod protein FlgB [Rhodocyclaceae bacterium]|nr:flagellar basal body rod protein FlgB [Rhodocyclaceae bacterium]
MNPLTRDLEPLTKAIDLRAYRQQVLASNIANADTPNYKARDFDFKTAMHNAMAGQQSGGLPLVTTSGGHIAGGGGAGQPGLQYRADTQSAVDGNTVDMDTERAQIADNAIQYEILTRLISDRFSGMRAALANN